MALSSSLLNDIGDVVIRAALLLWLCSLAQASLCFDYTYVNLGNVFSGGDNYVNIACLGDTDCSIVYAQTGCQGCFDPSCIEGVARIETRVGPGNVLTIQGSQFSEGGISDGDLVCSTGQLSIVSGIDENLNMAHEWSSASLAGTKFVYGSRRNIPSSCLIYSFEGSSVAFTAYGISETSIEVGRFAHSVQGASLAYSTPIKISSNDKPVIVACSQGGQDYTNVYPASNRPLYGYSSQHSLGHHFDCATLSSVLPESTPVCEDAFEFDVATNVDSLENMYTISLNSLPHYSGPGMVCSPAQGQCLSMGTIGDGAGNEGTAWVPNSYFASFFVLPGAVNQVSIIGEASTEKCEITNNLGVILSTATFVGTSPRVRYINSVANRDKETRISCFGGRVAIVVQYSNKEAILNGRESPAVWSYGNSLSTCIPTPAPTALPSYGPTQMPRVAPLPIDGPLRGAVVFSISSVALLCTLSGLLVDSGKLVRKKKLQLYELEENAYNNFPRDSMSDEEMGIESMI